MSLEEMQELSIDIINKLNQLHKGVVENEDQLIRLNMIPDEEYKELRFISDELNDFSELLSNLPNYGISGE